MRNSLLGAAGLWVAPSILTLDAAAAVGSCSEAVGTSRAQYFVGIGFGTPANGGGCNPNTWNNLPGNSGALIDVAIDGSTPGIRVFTFTLCQNCTFTELRAKCGTTGNVCVDGVTSSNVGKLSESESGCSAGFSEIKLSFECV